MTIHLRETPGCRWNTYMHTIEERLGSFNIWPMDIKPLPITMAAAGFYHSNKASDGGMCFSCNLRLRDWKKDYDPLALHIEHSSLRTTCDWIAKITRKPETYMTSTPVPVPTARFTSPSQPRICEVCDKAFPSGKAYSRHHRKAHRLRPGRRRASKISPSAYKNPDTIRMGRHKVHKAPHRNPRRMRSVKLERSNGDES